MLQPYFVKGLIGKVLAYGGLQIRKYIPHGLQIPADKYQTTFKLIEYKWVVYTINIVNSLLNLCLKALYRYLLQLVNLYAICNEYS